ncbi:MAG: hypothetical protein ACLP59_35595 [Bryobacteraceae bacterium]
MRRSWNSLIWTGFAVTLAAVLSYIPIFARFAGTRDIPWVNLLLFVVGGLMLAAGLRRAYGEPEHYRGKVSGAVLGVLALALFGVFCWGNFVFARRVPSSTGAPQAGAPAPDFTLPDANGKPVSLAELRKSNRAVLLIFYRGYW